MSYQHIEIELNQASYRQDEACGDVFYRKRTSEHTTLILCDGKGHGIKANIAATMNISYLHTLIDSGFSTRATFDKLIDFFVQTGITDNHYSVFSIARIFSDGMANILSYSIPLPIFITSQGAKVLKGRPIETSLGIINESNCYIKNGEGIMLMSDGVTQAGIGRGMD
jgi:serine phosphatase RsbU (regulator of sigma subunit)